jgi:hypothetical protein
MTKPGWLPEMVSVNGDWPSVLRSLYTIFTTDFKDRDCLFQGHAVAWDRSILTDDRYEEVFWHLIAKTDQAKGDRLFDTRRAERLPWCAPTVEHYPDPAIKCWEYRESGNRVNVYAWLEDWDYVVVLAKRKQGGRERYFLVTAYHVDGQSTRRNLRRKYAQREV